MSEEKANLSIIIPVYDEPEALEEVVAGLRRCLDATGIEYEIICVDDGSGEPTKEVFRALDGVTLITHPSNRGYGAALKTGFDHARHRFIAFIDADCSYPMDELPALFNALASDGAAQMCIGSRLGKKGNRLELLRLLGNLLYAHTMNLLFSVRLSDVCSGMRIFRRELLEVLDPATLSEDLDFSPQLTARCLRKGVGVLEHPISYCQRKGYSKLKILRHGWSFLFRIIGERFPGGRQCP
jgi:glycosyltransferase involved in cell wall biosynthesis